MWNNGTGAKQLTSTSIKSGLSRCERIRKSFPRRPMFKITLKGIDYFVKLKWPQLSKHVGNAVFRIRRDVFLSISFWMNDHPPYRKLNNYTLLWTFSLIRIFVKLTNRGGEDSWILTYWSLETFICSNKEREVFIRCGCKLVPLRVKLPARNPMT